MDDEEIRKQTREINIPLLILCIIAIPISIISWVVFKGLSIFVNKKYEPTIED